MTSHASANSSPPPTAIPLSAAIQGFVRVMGHEAAEAVLGIVDRSFVLRRLQVGARAERALAGARQDRHPQRGVPLDLLHGLAHRHRGGGIDRVQALRPVEGHDGHGAVDGNVDAQDRTLSGSSACSAAVSGRTSTLKM